MCDLERLRKRTEKKKKKHDATGKRVCRTDQRAKERKSNDHSNYLVYIFGPVMEGWRNISNSV